jgi:hypothetical protein
MWKHTLLVLLWSAVPTGGQPMNDNAPGPTNENAAGPINNNVQPRNANAPGPSDPAAYGPLCMLMSTGVMWQDDKEHPVGTESCAQCKTSLTTPATESVCGQGYNNCRQVRIVSRHCIPMADLPSTITEGSDSPMH